MVSYFFIIIFVVEDEFLVKIIHYTEIYLLFRIRNISFMLTESIVVLVL